MSTPELKALLAETNIEIERNIIAAEIDRRLAVAHPFLTTGVRRYLVHSSCDLSLWQ